MQRLRFLVLAIFAGIVLGIFLLVTGIIVGDRNLSVSGGVLFFVSAVLLLIEVELFKIWKALENSKHNVRYTNKSEHV